LEKILETIEKITPLDTNSMKLAKERQDFLTKPQGSLGVLEELSIKVAGIVGVPRPKIKDKVIITMAGDHGVVEECISAFPQEVTTQMVYNFIRGGAGINVVAKHVGARVVVVDMGVASDLEPSPNLINKKVAYGTKNMANGPAMTRDEAIRAVEAGIEVVEEDIKNGTDIIGIGDMGIGNTTPSSAIVTAITGTEVSKVTGRGTGVDDSTFEKKVKIIEKSLQANRPDPKDPLDVLAKVGGLEIGGLAGVILAAAKNRIPVVLDGFISGAAALIAAELAPQVKNYMIASHQSVEVGHKILLNYLGLSPILDLNLRLGEGTGAALGISLIDASVKVLDEMATFADAGVSESVE